MKLTTLKCPACAAVLNIDESQTVYKCEYCQNKINIIKPIKINDIVDGLNDMEQKKYSNYLSILNQTMLAGNYKEGNDYCNKALEINPKSGSLWENKAICSFWLSTFAELVEDKVSEILTYLNASKQNDPNSATYNETAKSIADNLFFCTLYKYHSLHPDETRNNLACYSFKRENEILSCIRVIEMCFLIYPNIEYLDRTVELIEDNKVPWLIYNRNSENASKHNFDAITKKNILLKRIEDIKEKDPKYVESKNRRKAESALKLKAAQLKNKIVGITVLIVCGIGFVISILYGILVTKDSNAIPTIVFLAICASIVIGLIIGSLLGSSKSKEYLRLNKIN
jgi:hypothetical protein